MSNRFADLMARHTDAERVEIVTRDAGEYEHDAVIAAAMELDRRNLTTDDILEAVRQSGLRDEEKRELERAPLAGSGKIIAFFLPTFLNLLVARAYKAQGYIRKRHDTLVYTGAGCLFWIVCILLMVFWVRV